MGLTNYGDVHLFHRKMGLLHPKLPQLLTDDLWIQRMNFIHEELDELAVAHGNGNLADAADGLVDLVYVVMGTAVMMGLPWQALWDAVQYANIRKEKVEGKDDEHHRGVIKPPGWVKPDIQGVLDRYTKLAEKVGLIGDNVSYRPELIQERGPTGPTGPGPCPAGELGELGEPGKLICELCHLMIYDDWDTVNHGVGVCVPARPA